MKRGLVLSVVAVTLAGCQTNYTYAPIVANPVQLEMADARCQMMSSSAEQGIVAWGSAEYVAGAQIGNAIGNAVRVDQFMKNCMTLQGWKRVPKQPAKPAASAAALRAQDADTEQEVIAALALGVLADRCGIKLRSDRRAWLAHIRKSSPPHVAKQSRAKAASILKAGDKAATCKRTRGAISDLDGEWLL